MSQHLTKEITNANIQSVRNQILQKQGDTPFYGTSEDAKSTVTDVDHFPYTRFYRGVASSTDPIVFEREAGWRPTRDNCYSVNKCTEEPKYPNHCFEAPCSTVYPCYPEYLQKFTDRDALNVQLNNSCIVQFR